VVGAGPAGLECTLALSKRGYDVVLAEASKELGGRLRKESRLPGLTEWMRVIDHRLQMLKGVPNVDIYRDSNLQADEILEFGFEHVFLAVGSHWRKDGLGRINYKPIPGYESKKVLSPDDLMLGGKYQDGEGLSGNIVIYDDDHYFMGGALAEQLLLKGLKVTLVTPAANASSWTYNTLEQHRIQKRLLTLGANIKPHRKLETINENNIELSCIHTSKSETLKTDYLVLVTERIPKTELYDSLMENPEQLTKANIKTVTAIGDCLAPATIAQAIYTAHLEARNLEEEIKEGTPFKRERPILY